MIRQIVCSLKKLRTRQSISLFSNGISGISFLCLVKDSHLRVILGYRREIDKNCDLPDYHAGSSGNSFPTFRDNQSVQSSRVIYSVNLMFCEPCIVNYQCNKNQEDARLLSIYLTIKLQLAASHHKRMIQTICCIYRLVPPDDKQ